MANDKGSNWDSGLGCSYLLTEAECESDKENQEPGAGVELSVESDRYDSQDEDFLDNASVFQGNHLEVFQALEKKAGEEQILNLKRKVLGSAENSSGSEASETPAKRRKAGAKRRLFSENEANHVLTPLQVQGEGGDGRQGIDEEQAISHLHLQLVKSKNATAFKLGLFKSLFLCSYHDITTLFKNDKTTNQQWVLAVFGLAEVFFEASFELLKKQCSFVQMQKRSHEGGTCAVYLLCFNTAKSRETVRNLMASMLNVREECLLLQPPKIRGLSAALFWFKSSLSPATLKHGALPEWIRAQTTLHDSLQTEKFDFGTMVQWAYDHKYAEESKIAYEYALAAGSDSNARAFLATNSQAKHVKDCATMVRHYLRAETQALSMPAYIKARCKVATGEGSWKSILTFFNYQNIELITFINALKPWLKGVPKKNCLAFIGPPNTGKSMLCNSLIHFLWGSVLSFANHKSHFWLASLADARAALIDDATHACWRYFDTYLRNALDGYPVSIDRKHKAAVQIKAPPLLVTSNIDVQAEERYLYLHSRVQTFRFEQPCTDESGEQPFTITDADWKSFFVRLWGRLDLVDEEEDSEEDGDSMRTFTCSARNTNAVD
uniref:Replication protein E1 n=1 Tax=Bos taurus papillomavirus 13 TaxID=1887213 RepID=A0A3G2FQD0_BPV1|nr:E1 protein [Bos taurus papillomavirus 13]